MYLFMINLDVYHKWLSFLAILKYSSKLRSSKYIRIRKYIRIHCKRLYKINELTKSMLIWVYIFILNTCFPIHLNPDMSISRMPLSRWIPTPKGCILGPRLRGLGKNPLLLEKSIQED